MARPVKVKALLKSIIPHGFNVFTLNFSLPKRYTKFSPGQFAHLTLDKFDPTMGYWPDSRVFSIASEPNKDELTFVYSIKGEYTKRMERELKEGNEFWLKLPYGDFTIEQENDLNSPIILVAGGTGISPFIPYLLNKNKSNSERVVKLFYGFRNQELFIFEKKLEEACTIMPNLELNYFSEESILGRSVQLGVLNMEDIYGKTKGLTNPIYFLSGPPEMIVNFKKTLLEKNVSKDSIRVDAWE